MKSDRAQALMAEVEGLKAVLAEQGAAEEQARGQLQALLEALPNVPAPEVPPGEDEHSNVEVRRFGSPFAIASPKDHVALGEGLGFMNFEAAARMSGAPSTPRCTKPPTQPSSIDT